MATPTSYRDLKVWQNAIQLAVDIYDLAGNLPTTERPGLATQLQQTAASIPTYIAQGHSTRTRAGMAEKCREALQTCGHLETELFIAGQLYPNVPSNDLIDQLNDVQDMLRQVIVRLDKHSGPHKSV